MTSLCEHNGISVQSDGFSQEGDLDMSSSSYNKLSVKEQFVIVKKGTEPPFSGEYDAFYETGTYVCRR